MFHCYIQNLFFASVKKQFFFTMSADDRPVNIRTDASADDFWSRIRGSDEISPIDFRLRKPEVRRPTPFGRQDYPRNFPTVVMSPYNPLQISRSVERIEFRNAIKEAEAHTNEFNLLLRENEELKKRIKTLESNVTRVLRINHALTNNMLNK